MDRDKSFGALLRIYEQFNSAPFDFFHFKYGNWQLKKMKNALNLVFLDLGASNLVFIPIIHIPYGLY